MVFMNLFRKNSHITLWSCLLALCFDPTTLIEIAVYTFSNQVKSTEDRNAIKKHGNAIYTFLT